MAVQVAVSLTLISVALLCIDQLRRDAGRASGINLDRVAILKVVFDQQRYSPALAIETAKRIVERATSIRGLVTAALSSSLPMAATEVGHVATTDTPLTRPAEIIAATPTVFEALGLNLIEGRTFTAREVEASSRVVVLSSSLSLRLFGRSGAIGHEVVVRRAFEHDQDTKSGVRWRVVGVVADAGMDTRSNGAREAVYRPLDRQFRGPLFVIASTVEDPGRTADSLRRILSTIDPNPGFFQAASGRSLLGEEALFFRLVAAAAGILGAVALSLALAGLYGTLSHVVAGRRHELGVRLALGASRADVIRMIVADGLYPVAIGMASGLTVGAIARISLTPLFVRLLPTVDPVIIICVLALMFVAAFMASYLPARKAASIQPNVVLRDS